jgi:hypothetical protein
MKLVLATLADFALAHDDGKLYITGGGIRRLTFRVLPAVHPRVSLALDVELDAQDRSQQQHTVLIQATDSLGQPFIKPEVLTVSLTPTMLLSEADHLPIVYHMQNLTFQHEGDHVFTVTIGGAETSLPLRVNVAAGSATEWGEVAELLGQGFAAFSNRDLATAERNFRAVLAVMPGFGMAHNNLGFVLLDKGQAREALAEFTLAGETGFDRPELLDSNMGCCHYLLGDPATGLQLFDRCLTERSFSTGSLLHGISGDQLFVVSLPSAVAYAALMALNAAWSAFRAGRLPTARERLATASALVTVAASQPLSAALEGLTKELGGQA